MFTSHRVPHPCRRFLLLVVLLLALAPASLASHFRYTQISWARTPGGLPNQVDITVTMAWRDPVFEGGLFSLSDGSSFCFNIVPVQSGCTPGATGVTMTDLGTFVDLSGEVFRVGRGVLTHQFPGEGPWTISAGNCCRIYSLQNASGASWDVSSTIDLRDGNQGGPASTIPVVLQVPVDTLYSQALPIGDPDGDPLTCSEALPGVSGIPSTPMIGGNPLTITNGCVLNWDTNGGVVGNKYAYQISINDNHAGGGQSKTVLDFIIELVGASSQPTCQGGGNFTIGPCQTISESIIGDHPTGASLTFTVLGVQPPGSSFSPAPGTTMAPPFQVDFDWTPGSGQANTAWAMTVVFEDPSGFQAVCPLGVTVLPGGGAPTGYCTAKTNSCNTVPQIGFSGTPSSTVMFGFDVTLDNARGSNPGPNNNLKNGMLLYSIGGPDNRPFFRGVLCLASPVRRTTALPPAVPGTPGQCDARHSIDMNAFAHGLIQNQRAPDPALLICGTQVWAQWWARDTVGNGPLLSNALTWFQGL